MAEKNLKKDDYGRPIAGSLTEMRGQKAHIHVSKEIVQLCEIIESEGQSYSEENPDLRAVFFGDLFSLYTHISNKLVGVLMRAKKYKFIDFKGEMLFQRRDDAVPICMVKTLAEIKAELKQQQDEIQSQMSEKPKPTNVLLNK